MSSSSPPKASPLLPARFLFRFEVPCLFQKPLWAPKGAELGEAHRLPGFGALEGRGEFADVRVAWSEEGLAFAVRVAGKKQAVRCHERRMDESDGLQVWIDTRDTQTIHRAGRFCHRFAFLPAGGGRGRDQPLADQLLIHRAREHPRPLRPGELQVKSTRKRDGYLLEGHVPAAALTGFDPGEYDRLGFTYCVLDHEHGEQTFGVSSDLPFAEDPSLWGSLELVRE